MVRAPKQPTSALVLLLILRVPKQPASRVRIRVRRAKEATAASVAWSPQLIARSCV